MSTTTPSTTTAGAPPALDRDWITAEFLKGVAAERDLADSARSRAGSPPEPSLAVLYNQIAQADDQHRRVVETVATRYGHSPARDESSGGGIGAAIGRIGEKMADSVRGHSPLQKLGDDLAAKANAIHWYQAWATAFRALGDDRSAAELEAVLTEETAHRDALLAALARLIERGARTGDPLAE